MPDVILAHSSAAVAPLLQESRTIPIVFTLVADPVGAGYVSNLARPGGNVTGFTNFEYSIGGKWLELLKEIAPNVKRVRGAAGILCCVRPGTVRRDPGRVAVARRGVAAASICAMPARSSGTSRHLPAGFGWRLDRDRQPGGDGPPRI